MLEGPMVAPGDIPVAYNVWVTPSRLSVLSSNVPDINELPGELSLSVKEAYVATPIIPTTRIKIRLKPNIFFIITARCGSFAFSD
jgi:hypothetical protein